MENEVDLDWARFFATFRPACVRFAQGLTGRAEAAEDVFQEAAGAMVARNRAGKLRLESTTHARNYLFRAVHNLAVEGARRAGQGPRTSAASLSELATDDPAPDAVLAGKEASLAAERRRIQVRRAIAALRAPEREVVSLRYLEGLSYREISERTHTAISTLHARAEAALTKIRKKIGKVEPET